MSDHPAGRAGLHLPGTPDQNTPTLFTCHDCGAQIMLPFATGRLAAEQHKRGCLGPALLRLTTTLTQLLSAVQPSPPEVPS
jgi:hypothetical protein